MTIAAITDALLTYEDIRQRLGLQRTEDPTFFPEWQTPLPPLSSKEAAELDHLSQRYLTYIESGEVSEGTLNLIIVAPLLNALGFCDPPYRVRGEAWVQVQMPVDEATGITTLSGRVDALTLQDDLWLVVIEGKRGGFNVLQAVPQALGYMMGNPADSQPSFGLVTNGYDYLFLKATQTPTRQFGRSQNFTLLSAPDQNLQRVGRILKRLVTIREA
jgi:predicted type IV restriction endonuclease